MLLLKSALVLSYDFAAYKAYKMFGITTQLLPFLLVQIITPRMNNFPRAMPEENNFLRGVLTLKKFVCFLSWKSPGEDM